MGFLGKLIKTTIDVAFLPVEVAKDIATLGGLTSNEEDESYTVQRLRKVAEHAEQAYDSLDDI